MSYLTRYRLARVEPEAARAALEGYLVNHGDVDHHVLRGDERTSWYDHDADVVAAMRATAAASVLLHGEGAETGDVWDKHFTCESDQTITLREYRYRLTRDEQPTETRAFPFVTS